jgi:hypothetical protein
MMARYTDWMLPYLKKQLEETKKYPGTGTDEKASRIIKITSLLEEYESFLMKNLNQEVLEQNKLMMNPSNSYIILKTLGDKVVKKFEIDDTLEVTVSEVSCMWAENLPTGDGNESLPSDFDKKD